MNRAGAQIAEQLISLAYTSIDWTQGNILETKNTTDFAINGDGFFMLNPKDPSVAANAGQQVFYTRDGQFHNDNSVPPKILNTKGLYYVTRADAVTMGLMTGGTGQHALAMPTSLGDLKYSKYGATIFDNTVVDSNVTVDEPEKQGLGQVRTGFLESSNVNTERQLVSLNESKKVYDALTKQLVVYWQNFDIGLNLLK